MNPSFILTWIIGFFISNYRRDWIVVKSENYLRFFDKRISYVLRKSKKEFEMR